jgi:hypothetical protein
MSIFIFLSPATLSFAADGATRVIAAERHR